MAVVHGFTATTALLEKYILGLTYEIRGAENLPQSGSYIVAAKHQSSYETFKLHILFDDPSIVLKKELLKIPLWGKYLKKSDVIAIDRSSPKTAIKSIQDGAQHVASQGRPIVIFPQGTRVSINTTAKEKPYKIGIMRIQEVTKLPIIPMATNTGYFQPKHKWCKKPGCVVFEFLKPIHPNDDASDMLKILEMKVEEASAILLEEAKTEMIKNKAKNLIIGLIALIAIAWAANWFIASHLVQKSVTNFLDELKENPTITNHTITEPKLSGFPFKIQLDFPHQTIETRDESINIKSINAQSWPFLGMPIDIKTEEISFGILHWKNALVFDQLNAQIIYNDDILNIISSQLSAQGSYASVDGSVDFNKQYPNINLNLTLVNFSAFLGTLLQNNIVKEQPAMFASIALKSLEKDGAVQTSLTSQDNKIYLGPIKVFELPKR